MMSSTNAGRGCRRLAKLLPLAFALLAVRCATTEHGYAVKGEVVKMKVEEKRNAIDYAMLQKRKILSLEERERKSRGLAMPLPMLGGAISLATDVVKKMIAKDRKKYVADYSVGLTDLYFYDQLSTGSCFDPVGMQFGGFTIVRTFRNKQDQLDTALVARFELDTTHAEEIINNSVFRLRLKDLVLNDTKAKITHGQKDNINVDMEITIQASYVNEMGTLFDNVELGKFYLLLRDAPLDQKSDKYKSYYDNLKNKALTGRSFIVPRSFGYYKTDEGKVEKCFSQGAYSIVVKITESSKDKFVTKLLIDNSSKMIDLLGQKAKDAIK
jgi:hypothetical protein